MSRIDGKNDSNRPASSGGESNDGNSSRGAQHTAWDPLEVWLTRIKQPRDRAARRNAAGSLTGSDIPQD
jgi:hypothetical protein